MKILVSKCLLGYNCRYKGDNCLNAKVIDLVKQGHQVVAVCPEQDGGLPTPRAPGEIVGDKVLTKEGKDITAEYRKGAEHALELARKEGVDMAVLKSKSPSCGCGKIYDGTFSGTLKDGNGVTAQLLLDNGVKVVTEELL